MRESLTLSRQTISAESNIAEGALCTEVTLFCNCIFELLLTRLITECGYFVVCT